MPYLSGNCNQKEPILFSISPIVNYLCPRKTGMTIEHFLWNGFPFHTPVKDGRVRNETDGVEGNPLPKDDLLHHSVRLHLALHLNIKNLQRFPSLESNHFAGRIHNGRICCNWATNRAVWIRHVDNNDLCRISHLLSNTDKFVRLHRQVVKTDVRLINSDGGELHKKKAFQKFITRNAHPSLQNFH